MNVQIAQSMNNAADDQERHAILAGFARGNDELRAKGAAEELVGALYYAGAAFNRWKAIATVREAAAA